MGGKPAEAMRVRPPLQTVDRRPWTADRGPQKGARIQGEGKQLRIAKLCLATACPACRRVLPSICPCWRSG